MGRIKQSINESPITIVTIEVHCNEVIAPIELEYALEELRGLGEIKKAVLTYNTPTNVDLLKDN